MSSNRLLPALLACTALVLAPAVANAAVVVTAQGKNSSSSSTTIAITQLHNIAQGDRWEVALYAPTSATEASSVTGPAGCATFTLQGTVSFNTPHLALWTCVASAPITAGGTVTATFGSATTAIMVTASASGVDTGARDGTNNNGGSSGTSLSFAGTNTTSGDVAFVAVEVANGSATFTQDAAYTTVDAESPGGATPIVYLAYQVLPGTAFNYTATNSTSGQWVLIGDAYKVGATSTCNGGLLLRGFGGC